MACANLKSDVIGGVTTATWYDDFRDRRAHLRQARVHRHSMRRSSMTSVIRDNFLHVAARRASVTQVIAALAFTGVFVAACDVHGASEPGALSTMSISPN